MKPHACYLFCPDFPGKIKQRPSLHKSFQQAVAQRSRISQHSPDGDRRENDQHLNRSRILEKVCSYYPEMPQEQQLSGGFKSSRTLGFQADKFFLSNLQDFFIQGFYRLCHPIHIRNFTAIQLDGSALNLTTSITATAT